MLESKEFRGKVANFWMYVAKNQARISRIIDIDDPIYIEVNEELSNIHPDILVEFKPSCKQYKFQFIVTALGNRVYKEIVSNIVSLAPSMMQLDVLAFRPVDPDADLVIVHGDRDVMLYDFDYSCKVVEDRICMDVYIKDLKGESDSAIDAFIYLLSLQVGEEDMMEYVGRVSFKDKSEINENKVENLTRFADTFKRYVELLKENDCQKLM